MRVSREKAAENRVTLLRAASQLFRERGIDGVGVAEVAKAAGLTHGALYAHFPSKDALVAEAFSYGFDGNMAGARAAWARDGRPSFDEHLAVLFSTEARDKLETGCPMTASASEIARQGNEVSARFSRAFEEMVTILEKSLEDVPAAKRRRLAVAAVAAEVGAIAVSRAVAKSDSALADEVLSSTRKTISAACKAGSSARRR